jgi:hypothetical protein
MLARSKRNPQGDKKSCLELLVPCAVEHSRCQNDGIIGILLVMARRFRGAFYCNFLFFKRAVGAFLAL